MTTINDIPWFQKHDILIAVGTEIAGHTVEPMDVVAFFEKPWHYEDEARQWADEILATEVNQPPALVEHARRLLVELRG